MVAIALIGPILGSLAAALCLSILAKLVKWLRQSSTSPASSYQEPQKVQQEGGISERAIPLSKFDWKATKPISYRPFQSKMHVAMGELLSLYCLP